MVLSAQFNIRFIHKLFCPNIYLVEKERETRFHSIRFLILHLNEYSKHNIPFGFSILYREVKTTRDMIFFIFLVGPWHNATLYNMYTAMHVYIFTLILFTIYFVKYLRFAWSCIPVNEWHRNKLNENVFFSSSSSLFWYFIYSFCWLRMRIAIPQHINPRFIEVFSLECNSFASQVLFY